jgi:CubicO group peptidase (beta-lactamase class C family)
MCLGVLLLAAVPGDGQTKTTPEKTATERAEALRLVDAWLDSVQAYQHIPAISAGVVAGDSLIWSKGYGTIDEPHTVPASPQTIYSICSISKLFTSVALMQQYEAGKVHMDEAVSTYLPWAKLKETGEESVPVTVRGILSHSAGLPRESDFPYWSGPDFPFPTHDQIRATISSQSPLFPAERYFQYSNLGLTLAGEIVEAVSGHDANFPRSSTVDV